jgi:hypothetical protein
MSDNQEIKNDPASKNKDILAAAVAVGSNTLRILIILECLAFPFFCFWFYEHTINIFSSWKTLEYFLCAFFGIPGGVIIWNWNSKFLKTGSGDLHYYDPRFYMFLPVLMDLYETVKKNVIPFSETWTIVSNFTFWEKAIECDLLWCLLMTPFLALYWFSKRTAARVYKETLTAENKDELDKLVLQNS